MARIFLSFLAPLLFILFAKANDTAGSNEERLKTLFDSLSTCTNDSIKHNINKKIMDAMNEELKDPSSFTKQYADIRFLGKKTSPDGKICVYSWNYPLQDKTYGYGGYIQYKPKSRGKIYNIPLKIKDKAYLPSNTKRVNSTDWYGALYYDIIPVKHRREKYYILLGWGGNNAASDFKVIDVLNVGKRNTAYFGKLVLKTPRKTFQRYVLEYSAEGKAALTYEKSKNMIVFDHLVPSEPIYKDIRSFYGPDFTYDAFKQEKASWILIENIDIKNKQ